MNGQQLLEFLKAFFTKTHCCFGCLHVNTLAPIFSVVWTLFWIAVCAYAISLNDPSYEPLTVSIIKFVGGAAFFIAIHVMLLFGWWKKVPNLYRNPIASYFLSIIIDVLAAFFMLFDNSLSADIAIPGGLTTKVYVVLLVFILMTFVDCFQFVVLVRAYMWVKNQPDAWHWNVGEFRRVPVNPPLQIVHSNSQLGTNPTGNVESQPPNDMDNHLI